MAVPRVFVSSTYYDLRPYRSIIADFIIGLGYEPIMHERSGVAYTQMHALETDCYHELASCDIVVCIIGNHFGTKSSESDLSITMEELKTALKSKKKIYVFVSNDVYIENRTYKLNRDNANFRSAYTDNMKIHEYLAELTESVKNHVILPFDTTDQIISVLKAQFAGLFQNLLAREASMTESKTAYDLQETADIMKDVIENFSEQKDEFFKKFDASIYSTNYLLTALKKYIGLNKASIFANDITALDEIMTLANYSSEQVDDPFEDTRKYVTNDLNRGVAKILIFKSSLFDKKGKIKSIRKKSEVEQFLIYKEEPFEKKELFEIEVPF